jgi:hypothetical protein
MAKKKVNFFGITSYRDLYWKCLQERRLLNNSDEKKMSYALFNMVVTLNHLLDLVMQEDSIPFETKLKCARRFNPYKRHDNIPKEFAVILKSLGHFPRKNKAQYLVRCICNKAKHMRPRTNLKTETVRVTVHWGAVVPGFDQIIDSYFVKSDDGEYYDVKGSLQ